MRYSLCPRIVGLLIHLTLALGLVAWTRPARADTKIFALVMATNRPLDAEGAGSGHTLLPLRFADDDAAAIYELFAPVLEAGHLLTVMDRDTQRLYPELARVAAAPTLPSIRAAVRDLRTRIARARHDGHQSEVIVFFSGHGAVDYQGHPALALHRGVLTRELLYDEVLEPLGADLIHVLVDACHAESVVRPRDLDAEVVEVSPETADRLLLQTTLARFPNVGAIVAASSDAEAHEWDALGHGVFTHELLSALRGGADVNHDRRVEYSEVTSFISAANRKVESPKARLDVVSKPPEVNRRASLIELGRFQRSGNLWLTGVSGRYGVVEVSDAQGRRLVTVHPALDYRADLVLPAKATLYVRRQRQEARVEARSGKVIAYAGLTFRNAGSRERGLMGEALQRGLFAARYGRDYYEGYVDQSQEFIPVEFGDSPTGASELWPVPKRPTHRLVAAAGASTSVADILGTSHGVLIGYRPARANGPTASAELSLASDGPLSEYHTLGSLGWIWLAQRGAIQAWLGGILSGGVLWQRVEGEPLRQSPMLGLGPVLGWHAELAGSALGLWAEARALANWQQRDGRAAFGLAPAGWLGLSWTL